MASDIQLDLKLTPQSEQLLKKLEGFETKPLNVGIKLDLKNKDLFDSLTGLEKRDIKATVDVQFKNYDLVKSINALDQKTIHTTIDLQIKNADKLDKIADLIPALERLSRIDFSNLGKGLDAVGDKIDNVAKHAASLGNFTDLIEGKSSQGPIGQQRGPGGRFTGNYIPNDPYNFQSSGAGGAGPKNTFSPNDLLGYGYNRSQELSNNYATYRVQAAVANSLANQQTLAQNGQIAQQALFQQTLQESSPFLAQLLYLNANSSAAGQVNNQAFANQEAKSRAQQQAAIDRAQTKFSGLGLFQQQRQRQSIADEFNLSDSSLLGPNKTLGSFLGEKFLGNGGSGLATAAEAIAGGTRGIAGLLGGLGGEFLGGPVGAAIGGTLLPAIVDRFTETFGKITEVLGEAAQAGLQFQQSIVSLSGIFQANTNIRSVGGGSLSTRQEIEAQQGFARNTLLASRSKLLPLGIAGQQEAVLVQAIQSGAAQKGIILSADETATLAQRFGSTILAQRPELLNNPSLLRRDVEDVLSNSGSASRTVLGSLLRPSLGALNRSNSGEDLVRSTASLQGFTEAIENSSLLSVQLQRFSGYAENAKLNLGLLIDEFPPFVGAIKAVNDLLKFTTSGYDKAIEGRNKIEADFIEEFKNSGNPVDQFLGNAAQFLVNKRDNGIFSSDNPQGVERTIKDQVQIKSLLRKAGLDEQQIAKNSEEVDFSPESKLKKLSDLRSRFGSSSAFDSFTDRLVTNETIDARNSLLKENLAGLNTGFIGDQVKSNNLSLETSRANLGDLTNRREFLNSQLDRQRQLLKAQISGNPLKDEKGNALSADTALIASIQQQIKENERAINAERATGVRLLAAQVGEAKRLGDLKTSTIANLGAASGSGQAIALSNINSLRGQVSAAKKLLGQGNDEEVSLQISALEARIQEQEQAQSIAGFETEKANTYGGTFAGRRKIGLINISQQEASGAISPEVAQKQREEFKTRDSLNQIGETANLSKTASGADLEISTASIRFKELNNQLTASSFALKAFESSVRLASLNRQDKAVQLIKDLEAKGGTLSLEQGNKLVRDFGQEGAQNIIAEARFGSGVAGEFRQREKAEIGLNDFLNVEADPTRIKAEEDSFRNRNALEQAGIRNKQANFGNDLALAKVQKANALFDLKTKLGLDDNSPLGRAAKFALNDIQSGLLDESGNLKASGLASLGILPSGPENQDLALDEKGFKYKTKDGSIFTPDEFKKRFPTDVPDHFRTKDLPSVDLPKNPIAENAKDSMTQLASQIGSLNQQLASLITTLQVNNLTQALTTSLANQFKVGN